MITATLRLPQTITARQAVSRVLWDNEFTTDGKTRFESVDFTTKASGADVGVPAQLQCFGQVGAEKQWLRFGEAQQKFVYEANILIAYGKSSSNLTNAERTEAQNSFLRMFDSGRCFNNFEGVDLFHNYISGANATMRDPRWEQLVLSGNVVELTGQTKMLSTTYLAYGVKSYKHYEVRCVNVDALPSVESFLFDAYVCHRATTIRPDGGHGFFPQFKGQAIYPLWSKGNTTWIWEGFLG